MSLTLSTPRKLLGLAVGMALSASPLLAQAQSDDEVKIGFIVKKPEQAWFINEQDAATQLGEEKGFGGGASVRRGWPGSAQCHR